MLKEVLFGIYATSMFAPVAFVGANIAYYGFNENAQSQEYTKEQVIETPVYYESNNILTYPTDIHMGNVYKVKQIPFTRYGSGNAVLFGQIKYLDEYKDLFDYQDDTGVSVYRLAIQRVTGHYIILKGESIVWNNQDQNYEFNVVPLVLGDAIVNHNSYTAEYNAFGTCISKSDELIIKNIETETYTETYTNDIVGSLSNAMERTFEVPLFSWSTSSVLSDPIEDLCNVVGIEDSPLIPLFTYWTTITALFLALDILIKVPTYFFNR